MDTNINFKYKWFASGDIGGAAIIVFDILTVLTFISLILQYGYHFPVDIIMTHIIPGTVVGVLVGNALCIWLGFSLAKKDKRNVTAMPFGLDAPSAIGFVVCIVGPVYTYAIAKGVNAHSAGIQAWQIGVGCLFVTGIIKLCFSLIANWLKTMIPLPALLGAIGGVALALIGFIPITSVFTTPSVGLLTLAIVFLTMFAKVKLPFNISGIPAAIIVGTVVYYLLIPLYLSGSMPDLSTHITFLLPKPMLGLVDNPRMIIKFLPVIVPFSLLVVFGTMSVVESTKCVGENYKVRSVMVVDAIATMSSALFGGIGQTTPYAGFSAYKKVDARAGFLMINMVIIGIGGIFGLVGFIVNLVPQAAVAPVLLYVAFEIIMQGFVVSDKKHIAVLIFSFFPSIARLLQIKITDGSLIAVDKLQVDMFAHITPVINDHLAIIILGNGFIITGMLWASMLYFAIEHKWGSTFICSVVLAILSYFGIIHSLYISGQIYLPWLLPQSLQHIPLEIAIGYLSFGILALLLSKLPSNNNSVVK